MNQSYRNKHHRKFSQGLEDASSEGLITTPDAAGSRRSLRGRENLMATVVRAASAVNNILLDNCSLCTVYCDKQVQYEEYVQQQYDVGTGAMGHLYSQLNPASAVAAAAAEGVAAKSKAEGIVNNIVNAMDMDMGGGGGDDHHHRGTEHGRFVNPGTTLGRTNRGTSPTAAAASAERTEVERYYREFLFDEDSVVRSVGSRGAADDDE